MDIDLDQNAFPGSKDPDTEALLEAYATALEQLVEGVLKLAQSLMLEPYEPERFDMTRLQQPAEPGCQKSLTGSGGTL